MLAPISHALVSLHSHEKDVDNKYFCCSGVLIAPGVVLTVGHVFDKFAPGQLWIRPQVSRIDALPIVGAVNRHSSLDAAWFDLGRHPHNAETLLIDDEKTFHPGVEYQLYAYAENSLREELPRRVTAPDPLKSGYITQPSHQCGMSGGALCRNGALWGMPYERYTEVSDDSGCVLGMHQLWDGFLDRVRGIRRRGDAPQGAGSATAPVATHAAEIAALRRIVRELFSAPPLCDWDWPRPLEDGIPRGLNEILRTDERSRGKDVVGWIVAVTDAIDEAVKYRQLTLVAPAQEFVRDRLLQAMGKAARLCLDPAQLAGLQALQHELEVSATIPEGALIAVRPEPHLGWQAIHHEREAPTFKDRYTVSYAAESGVGDDAYYGILSAIASLRSDATNPTGASIVVNEATRAHWRGALTDEHDRGHGRCLIVGDMYRDALGQGLVARLAEFGVRVVVLRGGGNSLFWFEEERLLGRIQGFLNRFEKFKHWKTANDS